MFNVLNVFKIISIEDFEHEGNLKVKWIKLEYGSLAEAMWKKKSGSKLVIEEERIVYNYQFYSNIKQKIRNLGDCLLEQEQFEAAQRFYEKRIIRNENI